MKVRIQVFVRSYVIMIAAQIKPNTNRRIGYLIWWMLFLKNEGSSETNRFNPVSADQGWRKWVKRTKKRRTQKTEDSRGSCTSQVGAKRAIAASHLLRGIFACPLFSDSEIADGLPNIRGSRSAATHGHFLVVAPTVTAPRLWVHLSHSLQQL